MRNAYRRQARQHHPDQAAGDAARMAAVNEAYRILRHAGRRAEYDATLRAAGTADRTSSAAGRSAPASRTTSSSRTRTTPADDRSPARYPWRLAVVLAVLGTGGVLAGAALRSPAEPAEPDNVLTAGSCVTIEANRDAREVTCSGADGELVVVTLVPLDATCPAGLGAYRDRQGMGIACATTRTTTATPE